MSKSFLEIQPESCRQPLPMKDIAWPEWTTRTDVPAHEIRWYKEKWDRILFFDPGPVYQRIYDKLNAFKRNNFDFSVSDAFPLDSTLCACGCGREKKFKSVGARYFNQQCGAILYNIRAIITNQGSIVRHAVELYYGDACIDCGKSGCEIDHIVPVKHGGGGCWLSNFIPRCKDCHRKKTNDDFGWKAPTQDKPIRIKKDSCVPKNKWIPLKKKLPAEGTEVLVFIDCNDWQYRFCHTIQLIYSESGWKLPDMAIVHHSGLSGIENKSKHFTHWRPLLSRPKL